MGRTGALLFHTPAPRVPTAEPWCGLPAMTSAPAPKHPTNAAPTGAADAGSGPQRLAKRLAAQVPCSRTDAEAYILGGWVSVDGQRVESPQARVIEGQRVALDPKARLQPLAAVTLLWHKPVGLALPEESPLPEALAAEWFALGRRFTGDRSGLRPLQVHLRKLQLCGALGPLATGLVVLTQNPAVARKLTESASPVEHEWLVEVAPDPTLQDPDRREAVLQSLSKTLFLDGWALPRAHASWQSELRLRLAIKGDQPGQVRALVERAGLSLSALRRLRLGRMGLAGLPEGQWRHLLGYERF